jgi:hypothetical protein
MRVAIDASVPASSNSASTGIATPNTASTCATSSAPRSESPPSMKKSASRGTGDIRSVAAHSAASAISNRRGCRAGLAAVGTAIGVSSIAHERRQVLALELAAVGARQRVGEPEAPRCAIRAEDRPRMLQHLLSGDLRSLLGNDDGRHLLTEPRVRNAERRRVGDTGERAQHRIDLERRNLVAAAIDHFLDAADEVKLSVGVESREVAHPEPSVDEARGIESGVVEISVEELGSAHLDLADLALRDDTAVVVDQAHFAHERRAH